MQTLKPLITAVIPVADGESVTIPAYQGMKLTVITGSGCTATVSRVDSRSAEVHTTGAENQFTVAATTRTATGVDWPFYLISAAGGDLRVALV